jgi:hypothetical protein
MSKFNFGAFFRILAHFLVFLAHFLVFLAHFLAFWRILLD